jgi:hypothetical protein
VFKKRKTSQLAPAAQVEDDYCGFATLHAKSKRAANFPSTVTLPVMKYAEDTTSLSVT